MSLETGSQRREQRQGGGVEIPSALVDRPRLLARLRRDPDRTVLVCAPSGYGKSTLIEQWAEADSRRFCRVLLGAHHNDPVVLTGDIVGAITGEAVVDAAEINALGAPGVETGRIALPILREVLQREKDPPVLVLDELERIDSAAALAIVGGLAAGMPAGARLVLLSRTEPQMRLPKLRAGRHLNELGRDDLLMTKSESRRLLEGLDLTLGSQELDAIIRRTEGWPAALYLAGLAIGGSPDPGREIAKFDGDDRIVIDYIREEFLDSVTQRQMVFLRRASILERLSGPTCDAVLKRKGSARILSDLARANMLLIPLDRRDEWFRFHPLLREMLRADLRRVEPKSERDLHLRASEWWEGRGEWELAISQAAESGSVARVGELLWAITPKYMTRGLNASIVSWLGGIGEEAVASDAAASLTAAWSELTLGNGPKAEHWNNCAKEKLRDVRGAQAQSLETGIWLADAVLFREGVGPMRTACAKARARLPEDDPWQTVCSMLDGVGLHLTGDPVAARRVLRDGVRRGAVAAPNLQAVCMSQLALMAIDEGDWDLAEHEISHARTQIERCGLGDYPMVAIAFAVSAWTRAKNGRVDVAAKDLRQGMRLLALLDRYIPWYEAEALLALGRASARLGDPAGARELVKRASREIESIDDAPVLESWLAETERSLGRRVLDDDPLTRAETRVLQLLATHLSNPQIAAELNVSPNTVKTHVRSIYRKLGATTRQAAVERARAGDLLDR